MPIAVLKISLTAILVAGPTPKLYADPSPNPGKSCSEVLDLCDKLVTSQKQQIQDQDQLIVKLIEQRNAALQASSTSSTPWYFWAVLGVAGGVVLTRGLR